MSRPRKRGGGPNMLNHVSNGVVCSLRSRGNPRPQNTQATPTLRSPYARGNPAICTPLAVGAGGLACYLGHPAGQVHLTEGESIWRSDRRALGAWPNACEPYVNDLLWGYGSAVSGPRPNTENGGRDQALRRGSPQTVVRR